MRFAKQRRPEEKPSKFSKDPLEELAENGKPEQIRGFILSQKQLEPTAQDSLADRYYSTVHSKANLILLAPLAASMAAMTALRAVNDAFHHAASQITMLIGFGVFIFGSAIYGRAKSVKYEVQMGRKAANLFELITAQSAQERLCLVISEANDVETAYSLLMSGKVSPISPQTILAEVVRKHGTAEQAKELLGKGHLCDFAKTTLRIRCRQDYNPLNGDD